MVWLMCRQRMYKVHISHFMTARTGEKTKGPRRQPLGSLQKIQPSILDKFKIQEDIIIFDFELVLFFILFLPKLLKLEKGLLHGAQLLVVITENCVSSLFIIQVDLQVLDLFQTSAFIHPYHVMKLDLWRILFIFLHFK